MRDRRDQAPTEQTGRDVHLRRRSSMRMQTTGLLILAAVSGVACAAGSDGTAVQAIAGPSSVTVTVRAPGELAVSWSAVPTATAYQVFQAEGSGSPTLAAT